MLLLEANAYINHDLLGMFYDDVFTKYPINKGSFIVQMSLEAECFYA